MPEPFPPIWLFLSRTDLETELRQCREEGKDVSPLLRPEGTRFERLLAGDPAGPPDQAEAAALLDASAALPVRADFPFHEPDDLASIRAARPAHRPRLAGRVPADGELRDHLHGAWLGRVAGCLLGKPVEGWRRPRMWGYLRETGRFPLSGYFSLDAPAEVRERYDVRPERCFLETVRHMPEDDDTNYTTIGLALFQRHGPAFTPLDVAGFWLREIPVLRTCTAERVAYRNLCLGIPPPGSAAYRNPYREWIGAQIRADFWGYAAPGDPQRAAEYAWRDACVSHVKNGIYGEMWSAAMIAAAFVERDPRAIVEAGLGEIPERCRLAGAVREVVRWRDAGLDYDAASERIHEQWDENRAHDWCHVISNAMVVSLGLLWGEGEFGTSLTRAVQACFDTDCNGATVGSILGILHGGRSVPQEWTEPFQDTLETGVSGFHRVRVSEMAETTFRLVQAG